MHMQALRIVFFLLIVLRLPAQISCYTSQMQEQWFKLHPELKKAFNQQNLELERLDKEAFKNNYLNLPAQKSAMVSPQYTIPVVFHILHIGGSENISDAQVNDAVAILNRDFNKLNADTNDVVAAFKNNIGTTPFAFKLATIDPNGNCTNGIIRHYDPMTNWTGNFNDYQYTWPAYKYLNIYVVRSMGNGAAGYTFLPGSGVPGNADAIVILSTYVGSIGSGNPGTSRALTHEVGHWFNLQHTWGSTNNPGVACGDDGVSDTPITIGYSGCNLSGASTCNPPIVENMQNYMEYAYCQRMFTNGQSFRMIASINSNTNGRNNLSSTANLASTGITTQGSNCVPLLQISALPSATICSGKSLAFQSFTSNATVSSFSWTASTGAVVQSAGTASTSIVFNTPGNATVTCTASNNAGSVTQSIVVNVKNGIITNTGNYFESFEANQLPAGWNVVNNFTPGQEWRQFTTGGSLGSKSMVVPGELMPPNTYQILESPSFDFKNNPGALFTFKYAYARQDSNNHDVFKVQASKDCGSSWSDIWVPGNINLANASAGVSNLLFEPYNEWVFYNLTAHPAFVPFTTEDNVKIRFYFEEDPGGSGYGNRLYIDEVNYTLANDVNELSRKAALQVYPNPSTGVFHISFRLANESAISYSLRSVSGALITELPEKKLGNGRHELVLNENASIAQGIYFLQLKINGFTLSKKLIIE